MANVAARTALLLAPAAAGKTSAALDHLRALRRRRALLLVPDGAHKHRLAAAVPRQPPTRVVQFYSLAQLIILRAGIAQPYLLNEVERTMLIRAVLRDLAAAGRLPHFAPVAAKPGFVAAVGDLLDALRDAVIDSDQLAAAGVSPYDAELAAIAAAYAARLQTYGLADQQRYLLLAAETLAGQPNLLHHYELFVVDGFDQFTALQLALVRDVAARIDRTLITLTGGSSRPAYHRFWRTRRQLVAALTPAPAITMLPAPAGPPLGALAERLFELDVAEHLDLGPAVQLIAAADREREVRAALRQVSRLLAAGHLPEEIVVLARSLSEYAPLLREVGAEYGLPLAVAEGRVLAEAPPIAALLRMLRLPGDDYPRRSLVAVLNSGFCTLPTSGAPAATSHAPVIDRVARAAGVAGGLRRLRTALQTLADAEPAGGDADDRAPATPAAAAAALTALDALAAGLQPASRASIADYVAWVRARTPDLAACGDDASMHAALDRWQQLLQQLANAARRLDEPELSFADFLTELTALAQAARYDRAEPAEGRVAALSVLAARGTCFDHVVLLGMAEGEFPPRPVEPQFYSHRERALLAARGLHLPAADPADERSIFYEAVSRARRSLTLTRTRLDASGNELPPSPYLQALCAQLAGPPPTTEIAAGSMPDLDAAQSVQEQLVALVSQAQTGVVHAIPTALLDHVHRAAAVEAQREDLQQPFGGYEGVIAAADLHSILAEQFGHRHRWSVTQFNDFITCPFRFMATHLLKLDRRSEPEDGLERAGRGRLYHQILAEAGAEWRSILAADDSAAEHTLLAALARAAENVLQQAPVTYGFEPGAFWEWEQADIRRRLEQAMRRALQAGPDWAGFQPAGIEQSFGLNRGYPPLQLETPDGIVQVSGRIDRIDQRADGALALIDYKSSSAPRRFDETLTARDVQLPIYWLAVENLIVPATGQRVERAAFLHLGSGRHSPALTADRRDEALQALTQRVATVVRGVRSGDFAVRPHDECPPACVFQHICRRNLPKRDAQV